MARVQDSQTRANGTSSLSTSLAALPASGNSIIAFIAGWSFTTPSAHNSVADNQGNSFTQIGTTIEAVTGPSVWIRLSAWQLTNVGSTSGTYTVTATLSAASDCDIVAIELNNMVAASLVDQNTGTNGSSTTPSATLGSSTNAYDTILAGLTWTSASTATEDATNLPGLVREIEDNASGQALAVAERFVGATAAYTANWVLGTSRQWAVIAVALKEANARPWLRSVGTLGAGASGNVTPVLGTHAANDILLCVVHSSDNVDSAISSPAGWTEVGAYGTSGEALEANNTAAQRATVFWKRAASGAETDPTVAHTAGGSIVAQVYAFASCLVGSDPFSNTRLSANAASATVTFDSIVPAAASDLAVATVHYEDDPTTVSQPAGWNSAGPPATTALGNDSMVALLFQIVPSTSSLTPSTTVSGGTFANSVNVGTTMTLQKVSTAVVKSNSVFQKPLRVWPRRIIA